MSAERKKYFRDLASKWIQGKITPTERDEFNNWYESEELNHTDAEDEFDPAVLKIKASILSDIKKEIKAGKKVTRIWPVLRYAAACCAIFFVSYTYYYFKKIEAPVPAVPNIVYKHDVGPGKNVAILTLGDHSSVLLDSTGHGLLDYFSANKSAKGIAPSINTLTTPRGGQYQIVLADGTKVFLNAESYIKYSTTFTGKKREVELIGEAYFEVAKNPSMPFIVHTSKGSIEVLGTHFNVNAYPKEAEMKATLLEGSVKVSHAGKGILIIPGQQAKVDQDIKICEVDVNEIVAWKNDEFYFNNTAFSEVLRQLERWYDIDIDFSSLPVKHFNGSISRKSNLSQVLKMLEITSNVRFEINGKAVKVRSN